jgi:NADH-quinone oxidoreductase subunit J
LELEVVVFYAFAAVTVGTSVLVVAQGNPVYSVMLLIASFGGLAGLYVLLDAPFTAVTQIIIYAGAIMVLFLFTVMLLNVPREDVAEAGHGHALNPPGARRLGITLTAALLLELGWAAWHVSTRQSGSLSAVPPGDVSSVNQIGRVLFTEYALPFEVTSILILVAMVGAIVLARREPPVSRP